MAKKLLRNRRRKIKPIGTNTNAYLLSQWMTEYMKKNPKRKYSVKRKPNGDLQRWEATLEIIGPEKLMWLFDFMEKNNIDSFSWGELYEYAKSRKAKKSGKEK